MHLIFFPPKLHWKFPFMEYYLSEPFAQIIWDWSFKVYLTMFLDKHSTQHWNCPACVPQAHFFRFDKNMEPSFSQRSFSEANTKLKKSSNNHPTHTNSIQMHMIHCVMRPNYNYSQYSHVITYSFKTYIFQMKCQHLYDRSSFLSDFRTKYRAPTN